MLKKKTSMIRTGYTQINYFTFDKPMASLSTCHLQLLALSINVVNKLNQNSSFSTDLWCELFEEGVGGGDDEYATRCH